VRDSSVPQPNAAFTSTSSPISDFPAAQGLYDPANEHDACGVSFIADLNGTPTNRVVALAVNALTCLQHRGATNAEPNTGDGAGILVQVPHRLLSEEIPGLPAQGLYATGIGFLPVDADEQARTKAAIAEIAAEEGLTLAAWRTVPTNPDSLGQQALEVMPAFEQLVLTSPAGLSGLDALSTSFRSTSRASAHARSFTREC